MYLWLKGYKSCYYKSKFTDFSSLIIIALQKLLNFPLNQFIFRKKIYPVLYPGDPGYKTPQTILPYFTVLYKINTDKIFFQNYDSRIIVFDEKSNKEITKIYHVYFCIITFLCVNKETFMSINIIQFVIYFSRCLAILGMF